MKLSASQMDAHPTSASPAVEMPPGEQLLTAFLEAVPLQVYFKDLDSRFIKVSRQQATRLGFESPEELLGKTNFDVFAEDHARAADAVEEEIIRSGRPVLGLEERETHRDGSTSWVASSRLPLSDAQGRTIGTFGISTDITVRRRAEALLLRTEERWRTLLEHVQELIVLVNSDGVITYASPAVTRSLGYAPDELLGSPAGALTHEDDLALVERALKDCCQSGQPASIRHRVRSRDGAWRTLESTFIAPDDDPGVAAVLVISQDITEALAFERERERLEADSRVSQRLEAVGQLAAGIAHEINTPLQFVGDSINFLSDAVDELLILTGRYREALFMDADIPLEARRRAMSDAEEVADVDYLLERIPSAFRRTADGIERVRSIVQAMKRFSHTGAAEAAPADLNDAIRTTLEVSRSEYKYVAEVDFQPGALPLVCCNISEVNQVFLNLIVNSAHAIAEKNGEGGPLGRIEIETSVEGDTAVVRFTDDGPGIPLEIRDRIYEPFFTTKEVGKGTGQGLALARRTIENHRGRLECDSTVGSGTTFTIRLPLDGPAADTGRQTTSAQL